MKFPRAQPRAHVSSARRCILQISDMFFDYLITSIHVKLAEINVFEITHKILNVLFLRAQPRARFSSARQ